MTMSVPHQPLTRVGSPPAQPRRRIARELFVAGAGLAFLAAMMLWVRFGPTIFVDALGAVWTCL